MKGEQSKRKKRKTKARRGKRIKNALKHSTIFYQNIRGIKVDSLTGTVDNTDPTIICIVETHMLKEEEITIPGYETVFREDGANNSGGIMVTFKDNIETKSMQIQHEKSIDQALRVQIDNQKSI